MPLVARPGLDRIQPYKPGERPIGGGGPGIKLSANESALGPSPKAMAAYAQSSRIMERYPDANAVGIRNVIADRYGITAEKILMGIGSDELLSALVRAYAGAGDEVLYPTATFPMYRIYGLSTGANIVQAPDAGHSADVDALLTAVTERTKVVIVANPNNPTGTYLSGDEMARLRAGLRDNILLIIDAAYAEYVTKPDYDVGISLVEATDNTVMTRTFSKVHGMASLRIGWCYAHSDVVSVVGRIRSPFNVSSAAQAAGIAALEDKAHEDAVVAHTGKWRRIAMQRLSVLGLEITGTEGNFVCVEFPDEDGKRSTDVYEFLRQRNIIVRAMAGFGLPKHVRITIGLDEEMEACLEATNEFVKSW